MRATEATPSGSGIPTARGGAILAASGGLALVVLFALAGPTSLTGALALALALAGASLGLPAQWRIHLLNLGAGTVLLGQFGRGFFYADIWVLGVVAVASLATLARRDRRAWDLHGPGCVAALVLAAPLVALPTVVVSTWSWLGSYKVYLLGAGLFFSLRRLVPRDRADLMLWVFPLLGMLAFAQLTAKTHGLGDSLFTRLDMRNFYTSLPWGQSNFISAILEFCLCGTLLLAGVTRSRPARGVLLIICFLMLRGVLITFSRAGVVSLVAYAGILTVALGGRRGLLTLCSAAALLLGALAMPAGQVFMQRFSEPTEYASWAERVLLWQSSLGRFLSHPWTGIGLNQGRYLGDLQGPNPAHNFLLDVAMEQGVFGAVALLVLIAAVVRLIRALPPPVPGGSPRIIRVLGLAMFAQLLVHASVEPLILGLPLVVLLMHYFAWLCLKNEPEAA